MSTGETAPIDCCVCVGDLPPPVCEGTVVSSFMCAPSLATTICPIIYLVPGMDLRDFSTIYREGYATGVYWSTKVFFSIIIDHRYFSNLCTVGDERTVIKAIEAKHGGFCTRPPSPVAPMKTVAVGIPGKVPGARVIFHTGNQPCRVF